MLDLVYCGEKTIHKIEFHKVSENIVGIKGTLPAKTKGFTLSREGKQDAWDYKAFTTIYREMEGEILFSNDGSVYVKPKSIISFYASAGGTLEGQASQEVYRYEEIVVPTPVPDENYQFSGWSLEIPVSGEVEGNQSYTAFFESTISPEPEPYEPSIEERVQDLEVAVCELADAIS